MNSEQELAKRKPKQKQKQNTHMPVGKYLKFCYYYYQMLVPMNILST